MERDEFYWCEACAEADKCLPGHFACTAPSEDTRRAVAEGRAETGLEGATWYARWTE